MYSVSGVILLFFFLGFGLCLDKDYYIASEEMEWNYAPSGSSEQTEDAQRSAGLYLERNRHRIGSKYWKAVFVEYTDDTFNHQKEKPVWLGYLGPIIMAELGETLVVHFKNKASRRFSLHAHGVFYNKKSEGSPYEDNDYTKADEAVEPGANYTYRWIVNERDAPAAGDPDCLTWMYSSQVDPVRDINSGLIGPLLTCKSSKSRADPRPKFDQEFVLMFNVVDENKSWYLEKNLEKCWDSQGVDTTDPGFIESNKMHSINGFCFGNLPALDVCLNNKIRWHMIGGGVDIHTVNFHGQSLIYNHHRVSSVGLYPSQFATVTMKAQNKGKWMIKCQVHNHYTAGMNAFLHVQPCRRRLVPYSLTGRIRRYYIAAQETIWEYAPKGHDLFNNQPLTKNDSRSSFFFERGQNRIGGKYKKAVFRGYTDHTFRRRQLTSKSQHHLGILGPVIRGEEGDLIKVVFRNRATRPYSIHPQGVNYNKFNEGARYNDDTRDVARADDMVPPGKTKTYYWTMSRTMAPTHDDPDCLTHMYTSGVNPVRDTYSGLIGPMLVCKRGSLEQTKHSNQIIIDREYFLLFSVIDENLSWYLDDTIDQFMKNPKSVDKSQEEFKQSNRMHSINGRMYGNLEGLDMCTGDEVSWHVLALGSQIDIHSLYWYGHTVLEGGNRKSTVTVQPGSHHTFTMIADKEGDWALVCRAHGHYNSGMTALFNSQKCEDGYRHKKDLGADIEGEHSNHIPTDSERIYYIAAEEVHWDYVPDGNDQIKKKFPINDPEHRAYHYTRDDEGYLGTSYKKVVYRQYTDEHFLQKQNQQQDQLYVIGPMIKGEIGDTIRVVFKNMATRPYSIHAQGVAFNKSFEGAAYLNVSYSESGIVEPGQTFTYVWDVLERSGPGKKDYDCVTYTYYSSVDPVRDINSGLVGPIILCNKGSIMGNGLRTKRVKDIPLLFAVFDENLSWYLDENIAAKENQKSVDKSKKEFIESNRIPSINGLSLGSLQIQLSVKDIVDWYLMAIGDESDIHSIHFHGHTFIQSKSRQHRRDTIGLFPGTTETIRMEIDNTGDWLLHCHVNKKAMIGMEAIYYVVPSSGTVQK